LAFVFFLKASMKEKKKSKREDEKEEKGRNIGET
jgi:hypothetical protein